MNISDLLSIGAVVAAVNAVLGYWAKSRIEGSVKHDYDKQLERIKSELKRTDILLSERMAVFKLLQKRLVSIRRFCEAQISSENGEEFGPHPDDLDPIDNKSILTHWTELEALLDENLIFLSISCVSSFDRLRNQLSLGASLELYLASSEPPIEFLISKVDCYKTISHLISKCIDALYKDLAFSSEI